MSIHTALPPCRIVVDAVTGRTVFVAPGRAERPVNDSLETCPFCAGHEHLTPHEVLRSPADARLPWDARIVPNRYPFVVDGSAGDPPAAAGSRLPGKVAHGVHDVVIESPRHDVSILEVAPASWLAAWRLVHARLAVLARRVDLGWGMVFKNSGPAAGASLEHVHSQLVALAAPPAPVAALQATADEALWSALIEGAARDERIVARDGDLVALVPPAPRQPFETWIFPVGRSPWFHASPDGEVAALARLSREMVARLGRVAPGADYNWWLLEAPFPSRATPDADRWRWRLEIVPRVSALAGFELGTGCHICVETPATCARSLRAAADLPTPGPSPYPGNDR